MAYLEGLTRILLLNLTDNSLKTMDQPCRHYIVQSSIHLVTVCEYEAAINTYLPSSLLTGTKQEYPDHLPDHLIQEGLKKVQRSHKSH